MATRHPQKLDSDSDSAFSTNTEPLNCELLSSKLQEAMQNPRPTYAEMKGQNASYNTVSVADSHQYRKETTISTTHYRKGMTTTKWKLIT